MNGTFGKGLRDKEVGTVRTGHSAKVCGTKRLEPYERDIRQRSGGPMKGYFWGGVLCETVQ